jgi:hypothetical protein
MSRSEARKPHNPPGCAGRPDDVSYAAYIPDLSISPYISINIKVILFFIYATHNKKRE